MNKFEVLFLKDLYLFILSILVTLIFISVIPNNKYLKKGLIYIILLVVIPLIGFRDFNVGVDTYNYIDIYNSVGRSFSQINLRDPLWDLVTFIFSNLEVDVVYYFLLWAFIYVYAAYSGVKGILKDNTVFFLVLFLIVPNFFLFGVNTIRAGVASSIFLFSLRYKGKNFKQLFVLFLACLIHLSVIVPSFFYYISAKLKDIKIPLIIWCIMLPFVFLGISLADLLPLQIGRISDYAGSTDNNFADRFLNFVVYSISPILLGIYVLYLKKIKDIFYVRLLNTYILSNCIYILTFNIEYAERFAYMSEFLMPLLLVYPFAKFKLWQFFEIKLAIIMLLVFLIKAYKIFIL